MKSLRLRLALWFTLGFLAVTAIQTFFLYRNLEVKLRRDTFEREDKINPNWILQGSYSEQEVETIMRQMLKSSLTVSVPFVAVLIALGWLIARQSLRPIENLNRQLQRVSHRTLGQKVQLEEGDEQFRSLIGHLNEMLQRLDRSFAEMSEYSAKVAHELRTPLTILRHELEQSQGRIEPDLAEKFQEELLRLSHVVEQSLLIAKAEQGRLSWKVELIDLSALVRETSESFGFLAEAQSRRLDLRVASDLGAQTDAKYCKQILHALLTNALIHGRGDILVRLSRRGSTGQLTVWNRVRLGPSTSELTLGLGLRVVKALVAQQPTLAFRQHHGRHYHAASLIFTVHPSTRREPAPVWHGAGI